MHQRLISAIDSSVNYVLASEDGGFLESRFVQRKADYLIVYLSSHTGCNQACRFCHLTQTMQTMMTPTTLQQYIQQASAVLSEVDFEDQIKNGLTRVKFSFMARGEPLLNPTVVDDWVSLRQALKNLVPEGLTTEFCISTIFPILFNKDLSSIFLTKDVTIYYSIYSVQENFRKKWLGKAAPVEKALNLLSLYSRHTGNPVRFHSAFIEGENDSYEDISYLRGTLDWYFPGSWKYNIVRYNPYSPQQGVESSRLKEIELQLKAKTVTRVGPDVKASCGMFYSEIK